MPTSTAPSARPAGNPRENGSNMRKPFALLTVLVFVFALLISPALAAPALTVNKWAVVWGDNGYGNMNICGDNNARLMVQLSLIHI